MDAMRLAQLTEGSEFRGVLWLVSGQVRQTKSGDPYWEGVFQDASGSLPSKLWDSFEGKKGRVQKYLDLLRPGRALKVWARVDAFQGALQLTIGAVEPLEGEEADPGLFSPRSRRSDAEMDEEFDKILSRMKDRDWGRLLKAFRADPIFAAFRRAPAAKSIHHAWVGGLMEHSLSLARGVRALAPNYPGLDVDFLLCACFLHDAGKALEISSDPGFDYTTDGKLLGHIHMGARLAERLCDSLPGFSSEKRRHLVHVVLSHQGERSEGFGSPVDPQTPEAVFFHHLDNLDAKVQNCLTVLDRAGENGGPFTSGRDNPLRKSYYRIRPAGASEEEDTSGPKRKVGRSDDEGGADPQPRLW
ncbi:MAG: 3'-5' exoribonuclease YhaM family protein [Acidobacteriota bacterium]